MTSDDSATRPQRRATYRVQLRAEFDFAALAAQAGYLADLGISHVYCSPYMQAAPGSTHGYDVVDPTRISDDLGGVGAHRAMCDALRDQGLSQLLDIVPNHMSIADRRNRWWWDVLADGPGSAYAEFFDIDWEVDEQRLRHRILVPVLSDHVGRALENGLIRVVSESGELLIAHAEQRYPLSIETVAELLAATRNPLVGDAVAATARLPGGVDDESRRRRLVARNAVTAEVAGLLGGGAVAAAVEAVLVPLNTDVAALDHILNAQHHRLARWTMAVEEVNYRRFFDINTLVGVRMEDPVVFAELSTLTTALVRGGVVDGLRIDHIDGLRRPLQYAQRLRDASGGDSWLLAEKIGGRDEPPPPWVLDGTTGYDFLAIVNGLFVDPAGRSELIELHHEATGQPADFAGVALEGKRDILRTTLVSDVERLTGLLARICDAYPAQRDHTHSEIRDAVVELVAAVPVYRTYVDPRDPPPTAMDAALVRTAVAAAHANAPEIDRRLLDFIADLFRFGRPTDFATTELDPHLAESDLVLRLQQLCAAAAAKGVEDTAFYRHLVLVSLNEVGDSPEHFGVETAAFHDRNALAQASRPHSLLATSTHDTKRSEDVRCRIDLLSEIPGEWAATVRRWRAMHQGRWGDQRPDGSMEYLLYQTVVGAWPLGVERALAYMEKAAHEAKRRTSWLAPDAPYDAALRDFVTGVLGDPRFVADLEGFVSPLVGWGRVNSLSMTLLKLASPGVPDVYQGCELWDLSLVDPDDRRLVDYSLRGAMLRAGAGSTVASAWASDQDSGAPKLLLIRDALALRRRLPDAFGELGAYLAMRAHGEFADDVIAFIRGAPAAVIAIAQRRALTRGGRWGDTMISLPDGDWHNLCDGSAVVAGPVALEDLLRSSPVALLERAA
ncbi:MAG TPA: malto-oligosyltrehalose synthase [Candidatus Dormibacteraeota bacterium]|jgi:(1->4)-alpha-D-glucan 1-alpha-D-glucosylmutase|nr:malto-oligosyltrehalose synthase [Candidatus Dormibacteraeota bacterium]